MINDNLIIKTVPIGIKRCIINNLLEKVFFGKGYDDIICEMRLYCKNFE